MLSPNPFSLEGKTILITGGNSGIGKSIAISCVNQGGKVIICGRDQAKLDEMKGILKNEVVSAIKCDLTDQGEYNSLMSSIPAIDGIVHSAGVMRLLPLKFITDNFIKEMIDLNYLTPVKMTRDLIKSRKLNKLSSVVFITSINGGVVGSMANSLYGSTKAALTGFCKAIALELGPAKIRVNCIAPGMIKTEGIDQVEANVSAESILEDKKKYPMGDYGTPEDVANASIYLLSPASKWVTGITLVVDGGFTSQ